MKSLLALLLIALPATAQVRGVTSVSVGDYSLGDVCPNLPSLHHADDGTAHAKAICDGLLTFASREQATNNWDIGVGKFGEWFAFSVGYGLRASFCPVPVSCCRSVQATRRGMLRVHELSDVLQVRRAAVCFDAVLVIHLDPIPVPRGRTRSVKCERNHDVNGEIPFVTAGPDGNTRVAATIRLATHESAPVVPTETQALDAPKIRDLVTALVANDGPPLFSSEFFQGKVCDSHLVSLPKGSAVVRASGGVSALRAPAYCTATEAV